MIRNTFSILEGIGEKLERRLWQEGVLTWDDFLMAGDLNFIRPERKASYEQVLALSLRELSRGNSRHFTFMKRAEQWRLFEVFRGQAVCLDIETNGRPPEWGGYTTVVGLYDGYDYRCLVRGRDLTAEGLMRQLSGYKYLITFFGSAFDMPFLKKTLGVEPDVPHFDLCFGARRMGLRGGLKRLEALLGIERDEAIRGMDGYDAVLLWERAKSNGEEALDLLIKYNREDTINLMALAETVYSGLKAATGVEHYLNGNGKHA